MHQQQTAFENIAGKGEIARNEQFLLFPQCFLGVRLRRNVRESRRFMKNQVQIYVPKCPGMYEKHLLNLLQSSIPGISTSTLTIFNGFLLNQIIDI